MSGVIRGSCKACNLLQSISPIRGESTQYSGAVFSYNEAIVHLLSKF